MAYRAGGGPTLTPPIAFDFDSHAAADVMYVERAARRIASIAARTNAPTPAAAHHFPEVRRMRCCPPAFRLIPNQSARRVRAGPASFHSQALYGCPATGRRRAVPERASSGRSLRPGVAREMSPPAA